ncbi:MAG: hypothetical protein ACXVV5_27085 [Solirubrobacteraceae bacterium]
MSDTTARSSLGAGERWHARWTRGVQRAAMDSAARSAFGWLVSQNRALSPAGEISRAVRSARIEARVAADNVDCIELHERRVRTALRTAVLATNRQPT